MVRLARRQGGDDLNVAGIAGAGVEVNDPRRLDPRPRDEFLKPLHPDLTP